MALGIFPTMTLVARDLQEYAPRPVTTQPLPSLPSVFALAELLSARAVTSEALVSRALSRIEATNGRLTAFVATFGQRALKEARAVDAARAAGKALPAFAGVPIAVKDQIFVRGHWSRFGSRALFPVWSPFDDVLVRRLRAAGFILVGTTSLSELGAIAYTENLIHAPARNPWDLERTPGGSSGGSAAAVAAGLVPLAHGADGGGSLRTPSALCGLFTLKPTRGALPNTHGADRKTSLYIDGVMATSVLDVAAGLDILGGAKGPGALVDGAKQTPRPLKVRVVTSSPAAATDEALVKAVLEVAKALEGLGHSIERVEPIQLSAERFLPLWQRLIANTPLFWPSRAHPVTAWLYLEGKKLDKKAVWQQHLAAQAEIDAWGEGADLFLTPTTAIVAPPVGGGTPSGDPRADFGRSVPLATYTAPFNVSGQPAASMPVGVNNQGLPLGVQLAGKRGQDALVLSVCRQLEEAGVAKFVPSPMAQSLVV